MYIGTCYTRIVEYWKFLICPLRIHREKSVKIVYNKLNICVEEDMGLADKIFGTYSERQLKKIDKFVDYIE